MSLQQGDFEQEVLKHWCWEAGTCDHSQSPELEVGPEADPGLQNEIVSRDVWAQAYHIETVAGVVVVGSVGDTAEEAVGIAGQESLTGRV